MAESTAPHGPDLGSEGIPLDDLRPGVPTGGQVDGKPVVVIRTADDVHVLGGRCTHYGATRRGSVRGWADPLPLAPRRVRLRDRRSGGSAGAGPGADLPGGDQGLRVFATAPSRHPAHPPSPPGSVVIVGSGAAGAAAAETLRREGYEGPVRMIGLEAPVDRPNLSKDYLAGTAPPEWIPLRSPSFYDESNIDLVAAEVTDIDRSRRLVRTADGAEHPYEALLLAPGAVPRRLPVTGAEADHVHYLRTRADAEALIARLEPEARAVVVGAGFIGLEVAASLRHRSLAVTVVAPEAVPLATVVGPTLGRWVERLHRDHGVDLRLGRQVSSRGAGAVSLDDGTEVAAGGVVGGFGGSPATGLAERAGLDVDNGIVVDDRLRTTDAAIWAAGDASYPGPDGSRVRWNIGWRRNVRARRGPQHARLHDRPFTDPPFFWSSHYGTTSRVTGFLGRWDEEVVVGDPSQGSVLVALRSGGRIRAVATIGRDRANLVAEDALARGDHAALEALLRQGAAA